ncbi:glutamine synthetase [bacterium]|nr:glutamine synthetase [bacterium]|tara:strand:- start:1028 stop:2098 length:1071 start_codon:yes stop_codon:yes gene_type:complete
MNARYECPGLQDRCKVIAHYLWLDGNQNMRYKTKVQKTIIFDKWNADGSSTFQAGIESSEIVIKPVKCVKINPKYFNATNVFNESNQVYIVLCDTYDINDKPLKSNRRSDALQIFKKCKDQEIMFGLEQEYYIVNSKTNQPESFVYEQIQNGTMNSQNYHYCFAGLHENIGRIISEEHMYACIDAGLTISGTNAEVGPHQWEFQIGPVIGIDAADQLVLANFLLIKIAEKYGMRIIYDPKPFGEKISGSGCHTNVSTKAMREDGGYNVILTAMEKLKETCPRAIEIYGEGNKERLTGRCETASWDNFSFSVGGRDVSVRIGYETHKNQKGYFEDRRPGANLDPYNVTSYIADAICN